MTKNIIIDPGHGGGDRGAYRSTPNWYLEEKYLTLDISRRVYRMQSIDGGVHCLMTRYGDIHVPLKERVAIERWATSTMGSPRDTVFISIHVNSTVDEETTARGVCAFFHHKSNDGPDLARDIVYNIRESIPSMPPYGGGAVSDMGFLGKTLYVLKHTSCTACLVEVGFINNAEDRALLLNEQIRDRIAVGIWDGCNDFWRGGG